MGDFDESVFDTIFSSPGMIFLLGYCVGICAATVTYFTIKYLTTRIVHWNLNSSLDIIAVIVGIFAGAGFLAHFM